MTEQLLFPIGPTFKGSTVTQEDVPRLTSQLERVEKVMSDGCWRGLDALAKLAKCPPASASARLRQMRNSGKNIERINKGQGYWLYRWVI